MEPRKGRTRGERWGPKGPRHKPMALPTEGSVQSLPQATTCTQALVHTALSSRLRDKRGAGGSVPRSSWTGSPSLALLLSPGVSQVLRQAVTTPRAHTPLRPHSFASTPQTSSSGSGCVLCQGRPAKAKWSKRISPGAPPPDTSTKGLQGSPHSLHTLLLHPKGSPMSHTQNQLPLGSQPAVLISSVWL